MAAQVAAAAREGMAGAAAAAYGLDCQEASSDSVDVRQSSDDDGQLSEGSAGELQGAGDAGPSGPCQTGTLRFLTAGHATQHMLQTDPQNAELQQRRRQMCGSKDCFTQLCNCVGLDLDACTVLGLQGLPDGVQLPGHGMPRLLGKGGAQARITVRQRHRQGQRPV